MSIEERPLSPVLQSELDALFEAGLKTIGCISPINPSEKIEKKLTEFLVEFEKEKDQFSEPQLEALLVQLGPVLAHLFIERYGWRWACAEDADGNEYYFVVSRDRKLMVQPWNFLKDFVQRPGPDQSVLQLLSVPELAEKSEEVQQADLLYQDIGMALLAMSALNNINERLATLAVEDPEARAFMESQGMIGPASNETN